MARGKDFKSKAQFILEGKDELKGPFRSAKSSVGGFVNDLGPAKIALGAFAVAGAAAAAAVVHLGSKIVSTAGEVSILGDRYDKLSTRLGTSVEDLSRYDFIAKRSGITTQNMTLAVQRMTRRLAEAQGGTGVAVKALEDLNIPIEHFDDMEPAEMFRAVLSAIDDVEDPTKRLATAFKFFDSEGTAVLQTLQGGIEGFDAMGKKAEELGGIMSTDLATSSAVYQDSLTDLDTTIQGMKNSLAEQFLPVMTDVVEKVTGFAARIASNDKFGESLNWLAELAGKTTTFVIEATEKTVETVDGLHSFLDRVKEFQAGLHESADLVTSTTGFGRIGGKRALPEDDPFIQFLENQAKERARFKPQGVLPQAPPAFGDLNLPPPVPPAELWAQELQAALEQLRAIDAPDFVPAPLDGVLPAPFLPGDTGNPLGELPQGLEGGLGVESALTFPEPDEMEKMLEVLTTAEGLAIDTKGGIITLPKPEEMDKATQQMVEAKMAVDNFGDAAEQAFIDDFSRGVENMIEGIGQMAVESIRTGESFGDAMQAMWDGFIDTLLSSLITLIVKLTVAAILQSYLGMGNPNAASNVNKLLTGFQKGGHVGRESGIVGRGDIVPAMLDPREFVLNPAATASIGVADLYRLNRGLPIEAASVPRPAPADLMGANGRMDLHVHTIYADQSGARTMVEEIHAHMVDAGLVAA